MKRGSITRRQYSDAVTLLLLAEYSYTSVDFNTIQDTLTKFNYETNRHTQAALGGLSGPGTDVEDAIRIATEVIRAAWRSAAPFHLKLMILDNTLRSLARGRVRDITVLRLIESTRSDSLLLPDQQRAIERQIGLWAAVHHEILKD
jgi:hypothetical protein